MKLDSDQQAVVDACRPGCVLSVIGAPATGKTTTIRAAVGEVLRTTPQARIAVLSPDRRAAGELRNELARELGALGENATVQSVAAFSFAIVSAYAQAVGRREPELLSGPDQDAILKEIFDLIGAGLLRTESVLADIDPDIVALPAFRAEYRDLITRAAELALSADELATLGSEHEVRAWVAGAEVMRAYESSLATEAGTVHGNPDRTDHARITTQAAAMLAQWERGVTSSVQVGRINMPQPRWDWVFVDDLHNCTLAVRSLLRVLVEQGTAVITFGDPDAGVQGFRGGIAHLPALVTRSWADGGLGAKRMFLGQRYRGSGQLAELVRTITGGIHVAGAGRHRRAQFVNEEPEEHRNVSAVTFSSEEDELSYIATHMRQLHLHHDVPYSQMAVITRSNAEHAQIRRTLTSYGVPVQTVSSSRPLRDQHAVAALLKIVQLALAERTQVEFADLYQVLTGPLLAIDPLDLRSIMRELRGWEIKRGGKRPDEELLLSVLAEGEDHPAAQVERLRTVRHVVAAIRQSHARGQLAEIVLWRAWEALDVAESWRERALAGGITGDSANENLDAVIQLFRIAQRLADRDLANAGIEQLLNVMESQDLPEDSIARTASSIHEVALMTPSSTMGRSWQYVFILGLTEGNWPNTRLRNPLTQVPELVSLVVRSEFAGVDLKPTTSVQDVVDDEIRMLLQAVTRASRAVFLSCVHAQDTLPSRFLTWLTNDADTGDVKTIDMVKVPAGVSTLDVHGLVGELRQASAHGGPLLSAEAEKLLAELVSSGVTIADSEHWVDQFEYSSAGKASFERIAVSPSAVTRTIECPLNAFMQRVKAQPRINMQAADIGTLIHQLAEEFEDPDKQKMLERFDQLWEEADFGADYQVRQDYARARTMVEKLATYLANNPEPAHRELWAQAEHEDIRVNARIDRIELDPNNPGKGRIVDYKTGKNRISHAEAKVDPQLMIYQWLLAKGGVQFPQGVAPVKESTGAQLVYVGTNDKTYSLREQGPLDGELSALVEDTITTAAELIRGPDYPARISTTCEYCAFASLCPAKGGERIFSA
ncbi:MAG: ATP-dependent helicase [Actinomycetaceae bacterium]|nr:ATP-dependent helicase [Actinomycetaceae bacterium]